MKPTLLIGLHLEPKNLELLALLKKQFPEEATKFKQDQEMLSLASEFLPPQVLLSNLRQVLLWCQELMAEIKGSFATFEPTVYLLPRHQTVDQPVIGCREVRLYLSQAFMAEELGHKCTQFLREMIDKDQCSAAFVAARLSHIKTPQKWLGKSRASFPFEPKAVFRVL